MKKIAYIIVGGTLVAGVGAYFYFNKSKKPKGLSETNPVSTDNGLNIPVVNGNTGIVPPKGAVKTRDEILNEIVADYKATIDANTPDPVLVTAPIKSVPVPSTMQVIFANMNDKQSQLTAQTIVNQILDFMAKSDVLKNTLTNTIQKAIYSSEIGNLNKKLTLLGYKRTGDLAVKI